MIQKLKAYFKGDRRFFLIIALLLLAILILGMINSGSIEENMGMWISVVDEKTTEISAEAESQFTALRDEVHAVQEKLKQKIISNKIKAASEALFAITRQEEFAEYLIEIRSEQEQPIAWNNYLSTVSGVAYHPILSFNETYFYRSPLITYIMVTDTLRIESELIYVLTGKPVEKWYTLFYPQFAKLSFTASLEQKFSTLFEIDYAPHKSATKDGRKFSFELKSNKGNKIGMVTFTKPSLKNEVTLFTEKISAYQTVLIVFIALLFTAALRKDFKKIRLRSVRFLLMLVFLSALRWFFQLIEFPSRFLSGELTSPSNFSSTWGGGIVKSPVELGITVLFFFIAAWYAYTVASYPPAPESVKKKTPKYAFIILSVLLLFGIHLGIRGFSAAIRSIIFDSSLYYFKNTEIIPGFINVYMNIVILILGLGTVLLILVGLIILNRMMRRTIRTSEIAGAFYTISAFLVFGLFFIFLQEQPLITFWIFLIIALVLSGIFFSLIVSKVRPLYVFIYAAIIASIFSISQLNYFNSLLERESLKRTAWELNRPDDNLFHFLVTQTLTEASQSTEAAEAFLNRGANYDAQAFILWSRSALPTEALRSSISILDKRKNILGTFGTGISSDFQFPASLFERIPSEIQIDDIILPGEKNKVIAGIAPVYDRGAIIGYLTAAVVFDQKDLLKDVSPSLLRSNTSPINPVLDANNLTFFIFRDSVLISAVGEFSPSEDQRNKLLEVTNSGTEDRWVTLSFSDEHYLTYVLKTPDESGAGLKITAVALKVKELTWSLFNFFKLFILHAIIILLFTIFVGMYYWRELRPVFYSFRTQILAAFLLTAILPLVALALYNRNAVSAKEESFIKENLSDKTDQIEAALSDKLGNVPPRSFEAACSEVFKETGISFQVFKGSESIFSTYRNLTRATFFEPRMNADPFMHLSLLGYNTFFGKTTIDKFPYHTYYRKSSIDSTLIVLTVNDAMNTIRTQLTALDFDIFLYGVYSFALLLIIAISTLLANRISLPIRQLTRAAQSVAQGDLNRRVEVRMGGEVGELADHFNRMIEELEQSQSDIAILERETAWKEMARQVAHEIKNPLTPMKLSVQHLLSASKEKKPKFDILLEKVLNTILKQIETLNQIASEFSTVAKMPTASLVPMDMLPLIREILVLFNDSSLQITLTETLSKAVIAGDEAHFKRMLVNMIRNAIQAEAGAVSISLAEKDNEFILSISDNGRGIPKDVRSKIFEENFTTKQSGMGLGLKLAKRFLESIKGAIYLVSSGMNDSREETGTTFQITIPKYEGETSASKPTAH